MESKDYKYNKETPVYSMPSNILCARCGNALQNSGVVPGFNKASCKAYDKKPMDVLLGRSKVCPKFS